MPEKKESQIVAFLLVSLVVYTFVPWVASIFLDFYIVKADFNGATIQTNSEGLIRNVSEVRLNFWGLCYYYSGNMHKCSAGYSATITQEKDIINLDWHYAIASLAWPILTAIVVLIFFFRCTGFIERIRLIMVTAAIQLLSLIFNLVFFGLSARTLNRIGKSSIGIASFAFFLGTFPIFIFLGGILYPEIKKRRGRVETDNAWITPSQTGVPLQDMVPPGLDLGRAYSVSDSSTLGPNQNLRR